MHATQRRNTQKSGWTATAGAAAVLALVSMLAIVTVPCLSGAAHADGTHGDRRSTSRHERIAARTPEPLPVYAARGDAAPVGVLPGTTEFGTMRVVLVVKERGKWLKVRLPDRPNGSVAWIRAHDVELRTVTDAVVINLTKMTLRWTRGGSEVLETPIAIGAPDTPTPTGRFYVTDLLDTPDAGAYGPYAVGLAAHSSKLSEFGGGDGQIGVHGTADPSSIGHAVSHGCVRVPNDVVTQLATNVPLGTPVTIR